MGDGFESIPNLNEQFSGICCNSDKADVWFICTSKIGQVEKIPAHKWFLALRCQKYAAQFGEDWINSKDKREIHVDDISAEAFKIFMHFIYEDKCEFDVTLAPEMLYLAKMYLLKYLKQQSTQIIKDHLKYFDAFCVTLLENLMNIGETDSEIYIQCVQIIAANANEAVKYNSFLKLDSKTQVVLLKQEKLSIKEVDLCLAVIKWAEMECRRRGLEKTEYSRKEVVKPFFKYLRFPTMTMAEISTVLDECELLSKEDLWGIILGKDNTRYRANIAWNFTPRTTYSDPRKIFVLGSYRGNGEHRENLIWEYNPETGVQMHSTKLSKFVGFGSAVAVVDHRVFLFGQSFRAGTCEEIGEVWNPSHGNSAPTFTAAMPNKIKFPTCCVIGKKVYMHGSNMTNAENPAALCYNSESDSWSILTQMPHRILGAFALPMLFNQGILLMGGNVDGSVFYYDIQNDRWDKKEQLKLPKPLFFAGVVKMEDGGIFICGGYVRLPGYTHITNKCWRLPPNGNEWVEMPPLQTGRAFHCVLIYQGKIVVIGGLDSQRNVLKSVEVFAEGHWKYGMQLDLSPGARAFVYPQ